MEGYTLEEAPHTKGAKIKIIGCGGGGGNTINYMIREGLSELDLIVANTDGQALNNSLAKTKIQLGEKTTGGLGAGGDPKKVAFLSTILRNFSFCMTRIESLSFLSSASPASASFFFGLPSKLKGIVTTETARAPTSLAALATMGVAPVPVPPPSPDAMKTISLCSKAALSSS